MTETQAWCIFVFVFLGELFARSAFLPLYYKLGIPVFQTSVQVNHPTSITPHYGAISQKSNESNYFVYSLGQVDFNSVGIKEAFPVEVSIPGVQFNYGGLYTPILNGVIMFNQQTKVVRVTAHLNWYVVAFVAIAPVLFHINIKDNIEVALLGFGLTLVVVIAMIQIRLYKHLLWGAANAWTDRSLPKIDP